jgi:hypothetical protein
MGNSIGRFPDGKCAFFPGLPTQVVLTADHQIPGTSSTLAMESWSRCRSAVLTQCPCSHDVPAIKFERGYWIAGRSKRKRPCASGASKVRVSLFLLFLPLFQYHFLFLFSLQIIRTARPTRCQITTLNSVSSNAPRRVLS